jgi:two-component system, LytTR family, response regulator
MILTAIILDDEKSACRVLNSMIDEYCPEISVKFVTQDPFLALEKIKELQPQILFLDINMPKMSGFEFLDKMEEFNGKIIFTTAYDQYAIQAFKYAAFDYLLKPIHVEHLEVTLQRLIKEFKPAESKNSIRELLAYVNNDNTQNSNTLAIHKNGDLRFIHKDDIAYIEASGNYCILHCEKEKHIVSKTLKEYEAQLENSTFIRIHKSFIVNLEKVYKYTPKQGGCVILKNGNSVPVSRRKRHLLNQFSI